MKVFLIENGGCEDYELVGIFTTRKKAENYLRRVPGFPTITTRILDPHALEIKNGLHYFAVHIRPDGNIDSVRQETPSDSPNDFKILGNESMGMFIRIRLWAKNKDDAAKAATTLILKVKPQWGQDWSAPNAPPALH